MTPSITYESTTNALDVMWFIKRHVACLRSFELTPVEGFPHDFDIKVEYEFPRPDVDDEDYQYKFGYVEIRVGDVVMYNAATGQIHAVPMHLVERLEKS